MKRNAKAQINESDFEKAPFNIEKIAKKIKCEHLVRSLQYKYVDPLIIRRTAIFKRNKNGTSVKSLLRNIRNEHECNRYHDNNRIYHKHHNNKLHYQNIQLQKASFKLYDPLPPDVFSFNPKVDVSSVMNRKRPYQCFLNTNSELSDNNVIANELFNNVHFSKKMKVSSVSRVNKHRNEANTNNSNNEDTFITTHKTNLPLNNTYINRILGYIGKSDSDNSAKLSTSKHHQLAKTKKLSKIGQIAKLSKRFISCQDKDKGESEVDDACAGDKKEDFDFITGDYLPLGHSKSARQIKNIKIDGMNNEQRNVRMRNREILQQNNNVSIDCIKSSANYTITKEQIIGGPNAHKVIIFEDDASFQRIKDMDHKIKMLVKN